MPTQIERVARAIWESVEPHRNWDARMSWYRATPEERAAGLKRGAHPDNYDHNGDVEEAFKAARAAIEEIATWHDEMAKAVFAAARQIDADRVKGCIDPDDRRSNIKDRDEHYARSHWHEGCARYLRHATAAALKEG